MENKVKDQVIAENYAIYNGDCMDVLSSIENESIDLSIYSPPFAGLYNYSSDFRDMSNCGTKDEFINQYEYLVKEMARVTKPGRINAVHCQILLNTFYTTSLMKLFHFIKNTVLLFIIELQFGKSHWK